MQHFTIDRVSWHTTEVIDNTESPEQVHRRFRSIINFLQQQGLTKQEILSESAPVTNELSIESSDLTEEGLALLKKCYHKWLTAVDRGKSPDDLRVFEKALKELRKV